MSEASVSFQGGSRGAGNTAAASVGLCGSLEAGELGWRSRSVLPAGFVLFRPHAHAFCVLLNSLFSPYAPAQKVSSMYFFPQKSMRIEVWGVLKILVDYRWGRALPLPFRLSLSSPLPL